MNDFYVYTWTRPDTGDVFYVGKGRGRRDVELKYSNARFMRIVSKLRRGGLEPVVSRVSEGMTEQEAFRLEVSEIARYGRQDKHSGTLVNLTDGGEGQTGAVVSQEHRAKIAAAHLGKKASAEARLNMSKAQKGRVVSPESRAKISASISGTVKGPPSQETRTRIGLANRGRVHTQQSRSAMSAGRLGMRLSEEHRANIQSGLKLANSTEHARARNARIARMAGPKNSLKGVTAHRSKWQARITVDGKTRSLGSFHTKEDAARAYDAAAIEAWGVSNCYINFPEVQNIVA